MSKVPFEKNFMQYTVIISFRRALIIQIYTHSSQYP